MSKSDPNAPKRLAIIASKGTLDWAYPPLILASAGAAMGWDVSIFHTFYGLTLLLKEIKAEVTPLGNPAMPMTMPIGPEAFQKIDWAIPTAMMAAPGFNLMATTMMKKLFHDKGVASVPEMRTMCVEAGVNMVACQMTMSVFGFNKEDFIPECTVGGAGMFLDYVADAEIQLFV